MDFDPFLFLSLWSDLGRIGSAIMQPLYWAVSGLIVLAHRMWAPLFGADSGLTWTSSQAGLRVSPFGSLQYFPCLRAIGRKAHDKDH